MSEVLILLDAKKLDWLAYGSKMVGSRAFHLLHNQLWAAIVEKCWAQGVQRSSQQCLNKLEGLRSNWQIVWDYEKNILSGKKGYLEMDLGKKKDLKTKAIVQKKVYDNISSWLPLSSRSTKLVKIINTSNTGM